MSKSCQTNLLISGEACEVQFCQDCGTIHLSLGPLTLRLREHHFEEITHNLRLAMYELQNIRDPKSRSVTEGSNISRLHN